MRATLLQRSGAAARSRSAAAAAAALAADGQGGPSRLVLGSDHRVRGGGRPRASSSSARAAAVLVPHRNDPLFGTCVAAATSRSRRGLSLDRFFARAAPVASASAAASAASRHSFVVPHVVVSFSTTTRDARAVPAEALSEGSKLSASSSSAGEVEDKAVAAPPPARPRKEYFTDCRSIREWREATEALLQQQQQKQQHKQQDGGDPQVMLGKLLEAARWWTTQRTAEGVRYGWRLWNRLEALGRQHAPTAASMHLTSGRYPRMMHLLNAILDNWRIVWDAQTKKQTKQTKRRQQGTPGAVLPPDDVESPELVFERLQSIDPKLVNARAFTILITAILLTMPAPPQPHERHRQERQRQRHRQKGRPETSPSDEVPSSEALVAAPVLCEQIFRHMIELSTSPSRSSSSTAHSANPAADVFPDAVAFTSVLNAWAVSGRSDAPVRALRLWSEWEGVRDRRFRRGTGAAAAGSDGEERSAPNVFSYNTLVRAMASTHDPAWIRRAADVVRGMLGRPDPHPPELGGENRNSEPVAWGTDIPRPNLATFRLIIGAYAAIRDARPCIDWLKVMMENGMGHVDVFSKVIRSAVVSGQYELAEEAYQLLIEAIESPLVPDVTDSSPDVALTMMKLYANTRRPHLAQALLEQLEAGAPLLLSRTYYRNVMYGWINAVAPGRGRPTDHVQPTQAYGIRLAAERAERLLLQMIETSRRDGEDIWADSRAIDSVLALWARSCEDETQHSPSPVGEGDEPFQDISPDARPPEVRAEALLRLLQSTGPSDRVQVSSLSYYHVMAAWSRSRHPSAADCVMSLLRQVEDDPGLVPLQRHYTVAIKACADRFRTESREDLEAQLESIFDRAMAQVELGNAAATPDAKMLGALLQAHARVGAGEAAERALGVVLDWSRRGSHDTDSESAAASARMSADDPAPTIREVNLVLLAWLRSGDPRSALRRCQSLLRRMEARGLFPDGRSKSILDDLRERAGSARR